MQLSINEMRLSGLDVDILREHINFRTVFDTDALWEYLLTPPDDGELTMVIAWWLKRHDERAAEGLWALEYEGWSYRNILQIVPRILYPDGFPDEFFVTEETE